MKSLNFVSTLTVVLSLSLSTSMAHASYNSKRPNQPSPPTKSDDSDSKEKSSSSSRFPSPTDTTPTEVVVDPEYLRERVLSNNLSLEVELNTVKDQKTTLNIDRAKLLPSINLNIGSGSLGNFMVSAIQFMFPFLMPSNWFQLDAQQNVFDAEKISYKILELNTYASALAMYYAILADNKAAVIYQQQADDLMRIYNAKMQVNDAFRTIPPEDLQNAFANANIAKSTASNAIELSQQEVSALRQVLSLPLGAKITVKDTDIGALDIENKPLADVVEQALEVAPEYQQINFLVNAAIAGEWNAGFGWINGASATATPVKNGSLPNFGTTTGQLTFHLGADLFPTIELSDRNVDEVRLRKVALQQEITQSVEAGLASIAQAAQQFTYSAQAESSLANVYDITSKKYEAGFGATIVDVLTAHANLTTAAVMRIRAQQDLNNQRVTLQRALILGQFSKIKGCDIDRQKPGFLSGIFGGTNAQIDAICREGGNNLKKSN
jgi:outer membrane protein TolC